MNYSGLEGYERPLRFTDITPSEVARRIDAGDTFVLFASHEACPWCNAVISVLNDAAIEYDATVFHMNTRTHPGQRRNSEMIGFELIADRIELETDGNGVKRLPVPNVFFIRGGKVVHNVVGAPDGAEDPREPLGEDLANRQKMLYGIGFGRLTREDLKSEQGIRLNDEFIVFSANDGETMLVATGGSRKAFSGLISINKTGERIVELLKNETSEQRIAEALADEYEVDTETVLADVRAFLDTLRAANALEEAAKQ